MTTNLSEVQESLIIQEKVCFLMDKYRLEVISFLGSFTPNISTFKVNIYPNFETHSDENFLGLLRIGSLDCGLNRELELRSLLNNYGLIAPLLAQAQFESVLVNTKPNNLDPLNIEVSSSNDNDSLHLQSIFENNSIISDFKNEEITDTIKNDEENYQGLDPTMVECLTEQSNQNDEIISFNDNNNLEDLNLEYLPEEIIEDEPDTPLTMIFILTELPSFENSLEKFLKNTSLSEKTLNLVLQLCQFCSHISEKKWNLINLVNPLIEYKDRLKFYDLTQILPQNEVLSAGLVGGYYAPELATASPVSSLMSSYTVGALLYQILHQKIPNIEHDFDFTINPIPHFYQILKIVLSPIPEERFPLSQLRYLLLEARQELYRKEVTWITASSSTLGLSLDRLQNEDNFGIRQQYLNNKEKLMLAVVADGMGGMAKGEIASKIAVEMVLGESIPPHFQIPDQRDIWLNNVFQKVNQAIATEVENGGTTLSVVLACNEKLMIAHVGDSRIYLIRQGKIQQLSQDHSYVALLINNGEITEEESRKHPDRNMLLKSLGSKNSLSHGYVQNLEATINHLVLTLENKDILLLCSDGVWDLVKNDELQQIFDSYATSLQDCVDTTIQKVLDAGASDNATLLALQFITSST